MHSHRWTLASLCAFASALVFACSSTPSGSGFGGGGASSGAASGGGAGSGGGGYGGFGSGGSSSGSGGGTSSGGPTAACPAGLQCNVACSGGATTTLTGKVYDPAGKNPLYDIVVYVPAAPLSPLPKGVPTGADACSCPALYKSGAFAAAATGVDGSFTLKNVPVGADVPLVLQVGKWRRSLHVPVTACQANALPDKSLTLPSTVAPGDTDDNMPDIAVSTGSADSLECLMRRIGLPASEYVAGPGSTGHVHVFSGGQSIDLSGGIPPTLPGPGGLAESPPMPGAPASPTSLWASQSQLMPYDITLLSCEGEETYEANPPALEAYLNAGGRVFASHFHYAWFAGPIGTGQAYSAPADWGTHLASWTKDLGNDDNGVIGGSIVTALNASTGQFAKGVALQQWLGLVGGLGQDGVPAADVSIYQPRYNAVVGPSDTPSQPWITASGASGSQTMYFSFDTPVSLTPPNAGPDPGGGPTYCGRAVFSDLHVAGNPSTHDAAPPPGGCQAGDLSPQEKALEFMLFDLSSCVIPDTVPPADAGVPSTLQ